MSRRVMIWSAVAVVLVAAVAGGAVWWFGSRPASAEDTARAYLAALARGDLDAVQAMREPLGDEAEGRLEAAFTGADEYLSDPRIEQIASEGVQWAVRASARLGGERHDIDFTLQRGDDGRFTVDSAAGTVTVEASLNGTATTLPAARVGHAVLPTGSPVVLLPARYTVTAAPADVLAGSADVVAGVPGDVTVDLAASLSPGATEIAQARLDQYAAACTKAAEAVPDHCGLVVPWAADLEQLDRISFRIERLPAVSLAPETSSFAATGGVLVATAHGTTPDGTAGAFTYRTEDWSLRGSLGFQANALTLTVH